MDFCWGIDDRVRINLLQEIFGLDNVGGYFLFEELFAEVGLKLD